MLDAALYAGDWALIGVLVFLFAHWVELEHEFFTNRHPNWHALD